MRHCLQEVLLSSTFVLFSASESARAETPGDTVLRQMDEAMTKAKDQFFEYDLGIQEPGKPERVLKFQVNIRGTKWRRIEFLAPGDVKGMRILILSLSQMYIYLPAYKKVRRVASHAREQGFMGSAYGNDEMSIVTYGDVFAGELAKENEKEWEVVATRRPEQEFRYAKLEFVIRKDYRQATVIRYFNEKGVLIKTETRSDFECAGDICNPRVMKMVDHTRNNIESTLTRMKWKANTGIPERFFTVRDLQLGH